MQFSQGNFSRGYLETGGQTADILQKVAINITSIEKCRQLYDYQTDRFPLTDRHLCAGDLAGGKDTCAVIMKFLKQ